MVCITVGNNLATAGLQGGDTPTRGPGPPQHQPCQRGQRDRACARGPRLHVDDRVSRLPVGAAAKFGFRRRSRVDRRPSLTAVPELATAEGAPCRRSVSTSPAHGRLYETRSNSSKSRRAPEGNTLRAVPRRGHANCYGSALLQLVRLPKYLAMEDSRLKVFAAARRKAIHSSGMNTFVSDQPGVHIQIHARQE